MNGSVNKRGFRAVGIVEALEENHAVSARRKDKDLAWINQVGIADLLPVRLVNYGVARARAVGEAADAPEAVAAGDGWGRYLRHDHSGGRASVWQNSRRGGRQLRLLSSGNVRPIGANTMRSILVLG